MFRTFQEFVKYLSQSIFKNLVKTSSKGKGITEISPALKFKAEKMAENAAEVFTKNNRISFQSLTKSDVNDLADNIVNPIKNAEQVPVKSAEILPFRFKRSFAEELEDASKKGDFNRMTGIMKVDPKFKEVMESLKAAKAADAAKAEMIGPKKLIPDRDVIPYQSPEVQKLDFANKLKRAGLTEQEYMDNIVKRGYNIDDAIYARDFYGDTTEDIIRKANTSGEPVAFADGGVAGLLGERQNFAMGKRAFLKLMGGVGAGIAGLKSGLLGLGGKQATKKAVTETVKQTAGPGTPPPYFFKLVEKIKTLGDDVGATQDRQIAKSMKSKDGKSEYFLEEDVTTGDTIIKKISKEDDRLVSKVEIMQHNKGKADELTKGKKPKDTYEEVTEYNSKIYKDNYNPSSYEDGINQEGISEIVEEAGVGFVKKADGGRIGYVLGNKVIGKGIMAGINKKFGKGTMTTADKIKRPQQALDREMFKKFETNYPETSAADATLNIPVQQEGKFTKAEYLIQRLENTIKGNPNDKYVQDTFPNFIKELKDNPELAKNENVFKELGGDLPEGQQIVVYGDDSIDFFTQKSGPKNIDRIKKIMSKYNISKDKALKIMKMEPNDQVMEFKMLEIANRKLKATGGLANMLGE